MVWKNRKSYSAHNDRPSDLQFDKDLISQISPLLCSLDVHIFFFKFYSLKGRNANCYSWVRKICKKKILHISRRTLLKIKHNN